MFASLFFNCNPFITVSCNLVAVADEDGGLLVFDTHKTGLHAVIQGRLPILYLLLLA